MKIAVTSAFGWPYVRRGNRVAYELAVYLANQGHEVHFITTKPGTESRRKIKENLLIKSSPLIDHPFLTQFNIEYWQTFSIQCFYSLIREDYDIVYSSLTLDAFAASLNKSIKGTPFIPVIINGDPLYKDARWAKSLFKRVVKTASRLVTISNFVNDILKRDFGADGVMIPCPVDTSRFHPAEKKETDTPRILFTSALTMKRKRAPLLVKAFERLINEIPGAILQLAGETNPEATRNLLKSVNSKTRNSIELLDITSDEVLASYYCNATISVLPSLKEPFGMVTTESLASGTPVVGTRSGGTSEILNDPGVGVLFEPTDGPDELCKALIKGIELAQDPQTSRRCSQHAERYSWNILGPKYEELQLEVLGNTRKAHRPPKKTDANKISSTSTSDKPAFSNGRADKSVLNKFYIDTLDKLEITSNDYYTIEGFKPRCLDILEWISRKGIRNGKVLVLSTYPHFLTILFQKMGFKAREIVLNNGINIVKESDYCEKLYVPGMQANLQESFDIIICDDLLQYSSAPDIMLKTIKKRLAPNGFLILSTPNAARGSVRLCLLIGKNIYPNFTDNLLSKDPLKADIHQSSLYREYTLGEVKELISRNGFRVIEKMHIIGNKANNHGVSFSHVSVKKYLLQKINNQMQRVFRPLRSHLFVVARKVSPADDSSNN